MTQNKLTFAIWKPKIDENIAKIICENICYPKLGFLTISHISQCSGHLMDTKRLSKRSELFDKVKFFINKYSIYLCYIQSNSILLESVHWSWILALTLLVLYFEMTMNAFWNASTFSKAKCFIRFPKFCFLLWYELL